MSNKLSDKDFLRFFDEEKIIDKATYTDFRAKCEGLEYVILGGAVAARDGVFTGEKRANVLLRNK